MKPYLLLTPGPLTTSETVKEALMTDWCTWDEDYNLGIVQELRNELVNIATKNPEEYTSILLQGSGTYCVEAVLGATITPKDKRLISSNGAYGDRMGNIAEYYHLDYDMLAFEETEQVSVEYVDDYLSNNSDITHVAFVHCETTTGILNPIKELAHIVKMHGKKLIVDCMSSFGGIPVDVNELGIDFLISSSNKCIQGVPGFGFIIARRSELKHCKGVARSLSLDIYDQWETMEKGHGKWRFTSPTHVVRAFKQALTELIEEGGVEARYQRYRENHRILVEGMRALGFETLLEDEIQSPIITSFLYPHEGFDFKAFYYALKNKGFVIYPGKISKADTFRISSYKSLLLSAHLGEALAAVDRTVGLGLERNLGLAAASCADCGEVLTGATRGDLARVAAGLAALGLVLEAALSVELLLTGGENELIAALFAN